MTVFRFLLISATLVAGTTYLYHRIAPGRSQLMVNEELIHFPLVSGSNLERQEYVLPRDFAGRYNVVFVPFQQWQQSEVNTWIPFARELEAIFPGVAHYELPTIRSMTGLSRTFINEGMRAGIPDPLARERTITLSLDKPAFKAALGIESEAHTHVFLVDRAGQVLWSAQGVFTPQLGNDLLARIQELRAAEAGS
jgi:hypothetical protein